MHPERHHGQGDDGARASASRSMKREVNSLSIVSRSISVRSSKAIKVLELGSAKLNENPFQPWCKATINNTVFEKKEREPLREAFCLCPPLSAERKEPPGLLHLHDLSSVNTNLFRPR